MQNYHTEIINQITPKI